MTTQLNTFVEVNGILSRVPEYLMDETTQYTKDIENLEETESLLNSLGIKYDYPLPFGSTKVLFEIEGNSVVANSTYDGHVFCYDYEDQSKLMYILK